MTWAYRLTTRFFGADLDAVFHEAFDFAEKHGRIDDDAVADHADLAGVQDAGRNQVKNEFLTMHHQSVAGVVPALKAHDAFGILGEQIDNLSFSLVAPLGSDDNHIGHDDLFL